MGLPWIQVDANLPTHRKSVHLAALLGDRRAWTYLVQLWSWASQNEPSGLVRGAVARMVVEQAAGWSGDSDRLVTALIESGWLDVREEGLYLHDWDQHQGAHIAAAEKEAGRVKAWREKRNSAYGDRTDDRTRTVRVREQDRTRNVRRKTEIRQREDGDQKDSLAPLALPLPETETPVPRLMLDAWNAGAQGRIPKARDSADRLQKLRRFSEHVPLNEWKALVARVNGSAFLRGDKGEFRATLDWVMKPANLAKILDGNYDDHGPPATAPPVTDANRCNATGCESAATHPFVMGDVSASAARNVTSLHTTG